MEQLKVRRARETDIDAIMVLFAQIAAYHARIQPDVYTDADMNAFRKCVLEQLVAENWSLWVAEHAGQLVAYGSVQLRRQLRQYGKVMDMSARLDCFVVDESCRHQGIGSRFLQAIETELRRDGMQEMVLTVSTKNAAAVACYEKAGYDTYIYQMRKELS